MCSERTWRTIDDSVLFKKARHKRMLWKELMTDNGVTCLFAWWFVSWMLTSFARKCVGNPTFNDLYARFLLSDYCTWCICDFNVRSSALLWEIIIEKRIPWSVSSLQVNLHIEETNIYNIYNISQINYPFQFRLVNAMQKFNKKNCWKCKAINQLHQWRSIERKRSQHQIEYE